MTRRWLALFAFPAGLAACATPPPAVEVPERMNLVAPCEEEPSDAREAFAVPEPFAAAEVANDPEKDVVALVDVLRELAARTYPAEVTPDVPPSGLEGPDAYRSVRDAAARYLEQSRAQLAAADDFEVLGFRDAQEQALSAFEERDALLDRKAEALDAGERTLQVMCDAARSGRWARSGLRDKLRDTRATFARVESWWRLTTALSAQLKLRHPELAESGHPLDEFPSLDWRADDLRLALDRDVPVRNVQRALHRLDEELLLLLELSEYVDAELAAEVARGSLRYAEAMSRVLLPACEGDAACRAPHEAERIAAQGVADLAEAKRQAARARFEVAIETASASDAFLQGQVRELDELEAASVRLQNAIHGMAPYVDRALERALAVCEWIGERAGQAALCGVSAPGTTHPQVSPPAIPGFGLLLDHAYRMFNAENQEPEGYGGYTYVLFPRRPEARDAATKTRYTSLLEAIVDTTDSASQAVLARERLNLFLIPTALQCETRLHQEARRRCDELMNSSTLARDLEHYDSDLARTRWAQARGGHLLQPEIVRVVRDSAGPFLLTLPEPLAAAEQRDGYGPLLFVDLANFHPATYRDVVNHYKATVVDETPVNEQVVWEPPSATWVQGQVLTMGDYLPELVANVKAYVSLW